MKDYCITWWNLCSLIISILIIYSLEPLAFKIWVKKSSNTDIEKYLQEHKIKADLNIGDEVTYVNGFKFEDSFSKFKVENYKDSVVLLRNSKETKEVRLGKFIGSYQSI